MARGDYTPEIKASMGSAPRKEPSKNNPARPRMPPKGAAAANEETGETVPDAETGPSEPKGGAIRARPAVQPMGPMQPQQGGMPPDLHHVAAATSIAHAILNRRGGGM